MADSPASDELAVGYDARPASARALRWRRLFRVRLISLGVTVVILATLYGWLHERFDHNLDVTIGIYAFVVVVGIAWSAFSYIAYRISRRAATAVGQGIALRISRRGVQLAEVFVAWPDVAELTTTKGRWPTGPELSMRHVNGESAAVPLEQLDIRPATVDGTARAYSAGRHGVDLSALEV
jgi:hypothetical protein